MTNHDPLPSAIELHVRSGTHHGVVERLALGRYAVGSSYDADIVLGDPGLDALQVHVELDRDEVWVECIAGDVVLGSTPIAPGTGNTARYPANLVINGVALCWRNPATVARGSRKRLMGGAGAMLLLIAAILISARPFAPHRDAADAVALQMSHDCEPACPDLIASPDTKSAEAHIVTAALRLSGTPESGGGVDGAAGIDGLSPSRPATDIKAAATALRQKVRSAGLSAIEVSADTDAVTARGSVDPSAVRTWNDTRQWFDQTYGTSIVLSGEVETRSSKAGAAPMSVQAIWAGPVPYVIDQRGQKYFEGSLMSGGWNIEHIEHDRVTLRRNSEVVVLRL